MLSKDNAKSDTSCEKYRPENEYTHLQEFIDNLPYLLMIVTGAAVNLVAFKMSLWGIIAAGFYILYGFHGIRRIR